jgi:hypothetical protein
MKAQLSFETSGFDYPVALRHIPEERNPQPQSGESLKTGTDNICCPMLSVEFLPTLIVFQMLLTFYFLTICMGHT